MSEQVSLKAKLWAPLLICHAAGLNPGVCGQVRFVVMGSVFPTEVRLHRKYDLKGSTQGRTVGTKKLNNPDTCLKVALSPASLPALHLHCHLR